MDLSRPREFRADSSLIGLVFRVWGFSLALVSPQKILMQAELSLQPGAQLSHSCVYRLHGELRKQCEGMLLGERTSSTTPSVRGTLSSGLPKRWILLLAFVEILGFLS